MAGFDRERLTEGLDPEAAGYQDAVWERLVDQVKGAGEQAPAEPAAPAFTRAQLRDTAYYRAHRAEIQAAMREHRIR